MPKLTWIGKEAVIKHHEEVALRLLQPVPERSCGSGDDAEGGGNLIVEGDNLLALKALLPRYAGQAGHRNLPDARFGRILCFNQGRITSSLADNEQQEICYGKKRKRF
jgi:hypothetical protein